MSETTLGMRRARAWRIGLDELLLLEPFVVMGVLNVTPDSFSDGGRFASPDAAVEQGLRLVAHGARILDIGGESTRPGATRVDAKEQRRRVVLVIERLRRDSRVLISIDTTLAEVAEAALDAGASIINDVSAGIDDPAMLPLIAARHIGCVLMHRVVAPEHDRFSNEYRGPIVYGDVVRSVGDWLMRRVHAALELGIDASAIALDPGLGFGKTVDQNLELIARLDELADLGHPMLIGASRKSFIGAATGVERPADRVHGSAVAAAAAWAGGARIIRTHDPDATHQALSVIAAIVARGRPEEGSA